MPVLAPHHRRYLLLLGVDPPPPPTLATLRTLVAAHLGRVPFENVSKLLLYAREGTGRPQTLVEFLDGIEHQDLGGTCYTSNPFLCELLQAIGYEAGLRGADMATPDVHTSIRVRIGTTAYHVDVGYGAPFVDPVPLSDLPHVVTSGSDRYVLAASNRPDTYELSMFAGAARRHGYVVHPPARTPEFFFPTIVESFQPGKTFMQCLRVSRHFADRSVDLRNRRLTVAREGSTTSSVLGSLAELRQAVDTVLHMPRCPIEAAVAILERLTGKAFFGDERWSDSLD